MNSMDPLMQPPEEAHADAPTMDFLMDAQSGAFDTMIERNDNKEELKPRRRSSRTLQIGLGVSLAVLLVTLIVLLVVFLSPKGGNSNSSALSGVADGAGGPGGPGEVAVPAPTPSPLRVNTPTPSETTNMPTYIPTSTTTTTITTTTPPSLLFANDSSPVAPMTGSPMTGSNSPIAAGSTTVPVASPVMSPSLSDTNATLGPSGVNTVVTTLPTTFPTANPSSVAPVVVSSPVITIDPSTTESTASPTQTAATDPTEISNTTNDKNASPELGSVAGVAYYHCPALATSGPIYHMVLLHGGSFTKENWNKVGILDDLCQYSQLSVSALDLSTSATHQDLQMYLSVMESVGLIQKPVVLVTPSASGYSMVDWMTATGAASAATELPQYVGTWIPVAVGSLPSASDAQIEAALGAIPVLAIYGDQDRAGGKLSNRLGTLVNATVVELPGGHPVYLWSPVEFVDTILNFLGVS